MRARAALLIFALVVTMLMIVWHFQSTRHAGTSVSTAPSSPGTLPSTPPAAVVTVTSTVSGPTNVSAHNLMLRKGPNFRIYVRWLRGQMLRTRPNVNPSFDDPESFSLEVKTGVIRANIGDITNFLNANGIANSPLKNVTLSGDGDQVKLHGTLHKFISLPIELLGTIT